MKLLIVEDELKVGDYLKQGLTEAGFVVDLVRDGNDGVHAALEEDYDLVVLDVMLPGLDGWQVLQAIRRAGRQMPVLFLTARDRSGRARQGTGARRRRLSRQAVRLLRAARARAHAAASR